MRWREIQILGLRVRAGAQGHRSSIGAIPILSTWPPLFLATLLFLSFHLFAAENPSVTEKGWFPFRPQPVDAHKSPIDLRFLNETFAGEHGWIEAHENTFRHGSNRTQVRFWAVNGPPSDLQGDALRSAARNLAAHGVNLVRIHRPVFNPQGEPDSKQILHIQEIVRTLKQEGIYTHLSIYFPLWLTPQPDWTWLPGYDGKKHPFAALMFHPPFQERYQQWWRALLTTPDPVTGHTLAQEPAVFGAEIQNEDSFFFWTFSDKNLPAPLLESLESQFGQWLITQHGSLANALQRWKNLPVPRDDVSKGRIGFRPLWNMAHERTARDQDTVRFLAELQRRFHRNQIQFLRSLGFKGLITAGNWTTADPQILGPIEKWTYQDGDFIDRHGYFGCFHKGSQAEWSLREGHTFRHRSALRFEAEDPGKPPQFTHPVMDVEYGGKPSMISETTFNRPNRFRSEAPLYFAAYGALQGTDAIVHFAWDGADWNVKPNFFMQPWTLTTPSMMGQFPAAALIFRKGLIQQGRPAAQIHLSQNHLFQLKGTPLPQDAAFDELRLKDVPPAGKSPSPGQRLDPLLHYVGPTSVTWDDPPTKVLPAPDSLTAQRNSRRIRSNTGELLLDYEAGTLRILSPSAQGISGNLQAAGQADLGDVEIQSPLDLGHIILVALDSRPLRQSSSMLLQVMSEEKATDFKAEPSPQNPSILEVKSIGKDPWLVRSLAGTVILKPALNGPLLVTPLDLNGNRKVSLGRTSRIVLEPETLYYLIER